MPAHEHQIRSGKTRKDKATGAHENRFKNRAARVAWEHGDEKQFPKQACNGKRNRHRWTGKGNTLIII